MDKKGVFPERLMEARSRSGLERQDLALMVGVATETIARYERGEREPKIGDLQFIFGHATVTNRQKKGAPKGPYFTTPRTA